MPSLRVLAAAISIAATHHLAAQTLPPLGTAPYFGVINLDVDATDTDHKVFRVRQSLPVKPGPLALYYPQWVPGTHSPTGTVGQVAGLRFSAQGKPLEWKRNTVDMHAFHVEVPAGVSTLDIEFQFLGLVNSNAGRVEMTPHILGVEWNEVLLYPAGHTASQIGVHASLTLPKGWNYGTALRPEGERRGDKVEFQTVDLETLVDSPVFAGRNFQRYDLDPDAVKAGRSPVFLNVVSDEARQAKASEEQLMDLVLGAGAEDLRDHGDTWEVVAGPESHDAVVEALQKAKIETMSAEIGMLPKNLTKLEGKNAQGMLKLNEALEEHDDVQNVYSNFDIDEQELEAVS
jgi:hypothetical protein